MRSGEDEKGEASSEDPTALNNMMLVTVVKLQHPEDVLQKWLIIYI